MRKTPVVTWLSILAFFVVGLSRADELTNEELAGCIGCIKKCPADFAVLRQYYSRYGDHDVAMPITSLGKLVLQEATETVEKSLKNPNSTYQYFTDGSSRFVASAYVRNIAVLNAAWYCSKMLESVEEKYQQAVWSPTAQSNDEWLHEVIVSIRKREFGAVLQLVSGVQATKSEVRTLLDECRDMRMVVWQMQDDVRARIFKNRWRDRVLMHGVWFAAGLTIYHVFDDLSYVTRCILGAGASLIAGYTYAMLFRYSCCEHECMVSNAIEQLIVERFLNGIL